MIEWSPVGIRSESNGNRMSPVSSSVMMKPTGPPTGVPKSMLAPDGAGTGVPLP